MIIIFALAWEQKQLSRRVDQTRAKDRWSSIPGGLSIRKKDRWNEAYVTEAGREFGWPILISDRIEDSVDPDVAVPNIESYFPEIKEFTQRPESERTKFPGNFPLARPVVESVATRQGGIGWNAGPASEKPVNIENVVRRVVFAMSSGRPRDRRSLVDDLIALRCLTVWVPRIIGEEPFLSVSRQVYQTAWPSSGHPNTELSPELKTVP